MAVPAHRLEQLIASQAALVVVGVPVRSPVSARCACPTGRGVHLGRPWVVRSGPKFRVRGGVDLFEHHRLHTTGPANPGHLHRRGSAVPGEDVVRCDPERVPQTAIDSPIELVEGRDDGPLQLYREPAELPTVFCVAHRASSRASASAAIPRGVRGPTRLMLVVTCISPDRRSFRMEFQTRSSVDPTSEEACDRPRPFGSRPDARFMTRRSRSHRLYVVSLVASPTRDIREDVGHRVEEKVPDLTTGHGNRDVERALAVRADQVVAVALCDENPPAAPEGVATKEEFVEAVAHSTTPTVRPGGAG